MDPIITFVICAIVYLVPAILYMVRVRPTVKKGVWKVWISGGIMALASMVPFGSMRWLIMFYIWFTVLSILLFINAIIWINATIRKKPDCLSGAVMSGVVVCSCILIGNWIAVAGAVLYFIMLLRFWFAFD